MGSLNICSHLLPVDVPLLQEWGREAKSSNFKRVEQSSQLGLCVPKVLPISHIWVRFDLQPS